MTAKRVPFSERYGYKPKKKPMQLEEITDELRTALWNALYQHYFKILASMRYFDADASVSLINAIWAEVFNEPVDEKPGNLDEILGEIKNYFFTSKWHDAYDFLEFVPEHYHYDDENEEFRDRCNELFERELAGYRFVNDKILRITSKKEIAEIEKATDTPLDYVNRQIANAVELLSKKKPDAYRHAIKDAISAVESVCFTITGEKKSLSKALDVLADEGIVLPASLTGAFDKLYGWSSSQDGIRHALMNDPKLDYEEALFMLVACSAFINYLIIKCDKAGIDLEKLTDKK